MKKIKKVVFLSKKEKKNSIFAARKETPRELSSVGSEHRPYKAGVVGSSPTVPTTSSKQKTPTERLGFLFGSLSGI